MKMKSISTRVLAVFAAVLLITALSIPAFAGTSYTFFPTGADYYGENFVLPSGAYHINSSFSYGGSDYRFSTVDPVFVSYGPIEFPSESFDNACLINIPILIDQPFFPGAKSIDLFICTYSLDGDQLTVLLPSIDGNSVSHIGATIEFIPTSPTISLSDYLPADTLPAVLNEVLSLLPLALGVLVGFIAIRKGIAYLQNFLHSS